MRQSGAFVGAQPAVAIVGPQPVAFVGAQAASTMVESDQKPVALSVESLAIHPFCGLANVDHTQGPRNSHRETRRHNDGMMTS